MAVLGGGVAGLGVGFYARRCGLETTVFEARDRVGGLSVTFGQERFLFDSGAHRIHDKDPEVTRDIQDLLGASLLVVDRPSMIFDDGRLMRFPFQLTDVLRHLGPGMVAQGALDLAAARVAAPDPDSFAGLAVNRYGRTLAKRFLLGYSRKLWGIPCERLSARVSGARLRGLDLRQFLLQSLLGRGGDRRSADGTFYYPVRGIGMLAEALARGCGPGAVHTNAEVLRLAHEGRRVRTIEVKGVGRRPVDAVTSTLPLDRLLAVMDPPPPERILRLAQGLTHRNLVLVGLFLEKPSVTRAATVYFPDPRVPFTRVTEPRNRSEAMSPPGHTSLVAEIPCGAADPLWGADDADLVELVQRHLAGIGWVRAPEVIGSRVVRLPHAYPVLSLDVERSLGAITGYLDGLTNLTLAGRNGRFEYGWIHNMLRSAKDLAESSIARSPAVASEAAEAPS
jgi:protoporphyrinogen oxidase